MNPFRRLPGRMSGEVLPTPFHAVESLAEVSEIVAAGRRTESLLPARISRLPGLCFVCGRDVKFLIEPAHGEDGPNFRETLSCPRCGLVNRWRGCLHLFEALCRPHWRSRIYLTEALTPVGRHLAARFPRLTTSEYAKGHAPGEAVSIDDEEVRNEDITRLTFRDRRFDAVLCFDVLEHVPDYRAALAEFCRVLGKDGWLILSVPFNFQQATTMRAVVGPDGKVRHLEEPSYHRNPLSKEGVLSFYDFGMGLIAELKAIGFGRARLVCYHSASWGYLGENIIFIGRKAA